MARDRRERLDDSGLPIGAYGPHAGDEYEKMDKHQLLRTCRDQRVMLDRLRLERQEFLKHIARLRGEEPGVQEDAPPVLRKKQRRLKFT
jgi:hypothetical protein